VVDQLNDNIKMREHIENNDWVNEVPVIKLAYTKVTRNGWLNRLVNGVSYQKCTQISLTESSQKEAKRCTSYPTLFRYRPPAHVAQDERYEELTDDKLDTSGNNAPLKLDG